MCAVPTAAIAPIKRNEKGLRFCILDPRRVLPPAPKVLGSDSKTQLKSPSYFGNRGWDVTTCGVLAAVLLHGRGAWSGHQHRVVRLRVGGCNPPSLRSLIRRNTADTKTNERNISHNSFTPLPHTLSTHTHTTTTHIHMRTHEPCLCNVRMGYYNEYAGGTKARMASRQWYVPRLAGIRAAWECLIWIQSWVRPRT